MKKLMLSLIIIATTMTTNAQSIWINGYIFDQSGSGTTPVPFATIYFCNYADHSNIEYVGFSDMSGKYDVGNNVKVQKYFIKIIAPEYAPRTKPIGNLPESFKGNLTLHLGLNKAQTKPIDKTVYLPKDIHNQKTDILNLITKVPSIKKDSAGNLLTHKDGSVKILLSGFAISPNKMSQLSQLPSQIVERIEYYDLNGVAESAYQGVLNVVVNGVAPAADKLDFAPFETEAYNIK